MEILRSPVMTIEPTSELTRWGGGPAPGRRWTSPHDVDVDDFYAADPRRGASPEVRFGGSWLDESGYPPRREDVEAEVFVLLTEPSRQRVDGLPDGWTDLQGQPGGFEELVSRLDKAGYPPPW